MAKDALPLTRKEKSRLKELGLRVRGVREQKKLTLEGVEGRGYPSWKHLQAIESGRKNLTVTSLFRLADALDTSPESLLHRLK